MLRSVNLALGQHLYQKQETGVMTIISLRNFLMICFWWKPGKVLNFSSCIVKQRLSLSFRNSRHCSVIM